MPGRTDNQVVDVAPAELNVVKREPSVLSQAVENPADALFAVGTAAPAIDERSSFGIDRGDGSDHDCLDRNGCPRFT